MMGGPGSWVEIRGEDRRAEFARVGVQATYTGKLIGAKNGQPTQIDGTLTLHGVTKPVTLKINSFKCITDMQTKKERCGADASGTINREEFGVSYGKNLGFNQEVKLQIQVEALRQ